MMGLARLLVRRRVAWAVVIGVAAATLAGLWQARNLTSDDDLLAFLPKTNPDVALFYQVNQRFGGLDVALIGIEAADVFEGSFLARLQKVGAEMAEIDGIYHVLSLGDISDFRADPKGGGVIAEPLIGELPDGKEASLALRKRVLGRKHIVGQLVSTAGDAVLMYAFLAKDADPKQVASAIQDVVQPAFVDHDIYWGGSPFISTYIYDAVQRDMRSLTPWAVLAVVLVMLLAFRDVGGTCLALLSTAIGIVVTLGLMATFGVPFNIVLGSMPVILFAVGSAYGIHMMARYYRYAKITDPRNAMGRALVEAGPVVVAAGCTTVASLLSFLAMDVAPLRTFGLFTAAGILVAMVLSLTFVPAVAVLTGFRGTTAQGSMIGKAMARWTSFLEQRRMASMGFLALVIAGAALFASRVSTQMDQASFFDADSLPARAANFLDARFGGAQFIQVHVQGELSEPEVLREIHRVGDLLSMVPGVTGVAHVGQVVAMLNEAMTGVRAIPSTQAQTAFLFSFAGNEAALDQLVTRDRKEALIHLKVSGTQSDAVAQTLADVEALVAKHAPAHFALQPFVRAGADADVDGDAAWQGRKALVAARILAAARILDPLVSQDAAVPIGLALDQAVRMPATDDAAAWQAAFRSELMERLQMESFAAEVGYIPDGNKDASKGLSQAKAHMLATLLTKDTPKLWKHHRDQTHAEMDALDGFEALLRASLEQSSPNTPWYQAIDDWAFALVWPVRDSMRMANAKIFVQRFLDSYGAKNSIKNSAHNLWKTQTSEEIKTLEHAMMLLEPGKQLMPMASISQSSPKSQQSLIWRVTGLPTMHRGLSTSVQHNQTMTLSVALLLVVVIMSVLFRSLRAGLMAAAPTALTLLVVYGGMGALGLQLDMGTSMLAGLILGAGVDYAAHLLAGYGAADKEAPFGAATPASRAAYSVGPAIWTNALTIAVGYSVLTLGEAKPLQNVGALTAAAMVVAAAATFFLLPLLAGKRRFVASCDPGDFLLPISKATPIPLTECASQNQINKKSGR